MCYHAFSPLINETMNETLLKAYLSDVKYIELSIFQNFSYQSSSTLFELFRDLQDEIRTQKLFVFR